MKLKNIKILNDLKNPWEIIEQKDIDNLEKPKKKIDKYKDLYSIDSKEDSITIYKIQFKNEINIIIAFENNPLNIQNIKELYFRIVEIIDEFINKFNIIQNKIMPNKPSKKGKGKKENSEKNKDTEMKDLKKEKKVEDFIFFQKADKIEENKIIIDLTEKELNDKIKKDYLDKQIKFSKVTFKGKTYPQLSGYIEEPRDNLINIKDILSKISNSEFEN